ncbi:MAG: MarR family winged helix-turn-helix transcriptional regulator [Paracoccus sp. (in: a-proteobacteria)]|uniref:MarR family winged helix-turn-helix transcriptional regulator n=1 Tax=Paracoccus sp. TaxID=267 RepID=UPI002E8296E8|nr:MarR family transcriptional regulator [Pseudomonadota bacterium]
MSFDLDGFLPYQLSVAATKISRRFAALYRAEAGLTIPEWRVLAHLDRSGRVSVRDITARVHLDKSMVSRAATRLEKNGIVSISQHETDRRLVVLDLTDEGRALMQRLGRIANDFQAQLLQELQGDAEPLRQALARIIEDGSDA